jgi:UDPglucose 6-dehydrogenase
MAQRAVAGNPPSVFYHTNVVHSDIKASVVGLGKLGAPLLAVLAAQGVEVFGIDIRADTVARINAGIAPVDEPQLQELLAVNTARIHATTDWTAISKTDLTYILVPTPSGKDGAFKNDQLLSAIELIGRILRSKSAYHLVVINSTTMPGSVGGPIRDRLEAVTGKLVGRDIGLCYNPEFVALGNVIDGLLRPDFVLIGESDKRAGTILEGVCRRLVGPSVPVSRMNYINAELTKLALNTYVTAKISFANMLSEICDKLPGADADLVTTALGQDRRIGAKYFRAATGYGGPCFPRDTVAFARMSHSIDVDASLATAAQTINERQVRRIVDVLREATTSDDLIAVLGLAYKPDTNVIEHSQGVKLAAELLQLGRRVIVHDPRATDTASASLGRRVLFAQSPAEAVAASDAVVVMVPWDDYKNFFEAWGGGGRTRIIVDCWRLIDPSLNSDRLSVLRLGQRQTRKRVV